MWFANRVIALVALTTATAMTVEVASSGFEENSHSRETNASLTSDVDTTFGYRPYKPYKPRPPPNIIWLDLEFTHGFYEIGTHSSKSREEQLDPKILEAALIVTDSQFNELARGQWLVRPIEGRDKLKNFLEGLADFHQENFRDAGNGGLFPPNARGKFKGGNGLFSDVMKTDATHEQVAEEMWRTIAPHCPDRSCPLGGFSVQADQFVLALAMPGFAQCCARLTDPRNCSCAPQ